MNSEIEVDGYEVMTHRRRPPVTIQGPITAGQV